MIEAPASREVVEELSFCWFKPHGRLASSSRTGKSPIVELPEPEDKNEVNLLPTIIEIKPAVQSQAPDVVHPPTLATTNSLHLVDYINESWPEFIDPIQPKDPSSVHPETSSIKAESSHPDLSDAPESTPVCTFERISGRRTTPGIQLKSGQIDDAGGFRPPPLPVVFSAGSPPPGEYDFSLLSEFPALPKKGRSCAGVTLCSLLIPSAAPIRPLSLLRKVGIVGPFSTSSLSSISDRTCEFPCYRRLTLDTDFPPLQQVPEKHDGCAWCLCTNQITLLRILVSRPLVNRYMLESSLD